jgi:hypothetical protein
MLLFIKVNPKVNNINDPNLPMLDATHLLA